MLFHQLSPLYIANIEIFQKKNQTRGSGRGTWGLRTWKFQQEYWTVEVWKLGNSMVQLKKKQNFQGCSRKNSCAMWNFHDASWFFLPLIEFWRGVTQFCLISKGESLFSLEFSKVKSHKSKISRGIL